MCNIELLHFLFLQVYKLNDISYQIISDFLGYFNSADYNHSFFNIFSFCHQLDNLSISILVCLKKLFAGQLLKSFFDNLNPNLFSKHNIQR